MKDCEEAEEGDEDGGGWEGGDVAIWYPGVGIC